MNELTPGRNHLLVTNAHFAHRRLEHYGATLKGDTRIQICIEHLFVINAKRDFFPHLTSNNTFWPILMWNGTPVQRVENSWKMILVTDDIWCVFMDKNSPVTYVVKISRLQWACPYIEGMYMELFANLYINLSFGLCTVCAFSITMYVKQCDCLKHYLCMATWPGHSWLLRFDSWDELRNCLKSAFLLSRTPRAARQ
jgi:hypothetical protein